MEIHSLRSPTPLSYDQNDLVATPAAIEDEIRSIWNALRNDNLVVRSELTDSLKKRIHHLSRRSLTRDQRNLLLEKLRDAMNIPADLTVRIGTAEIPVSSIFLGAASPYLACLVATAEGEVLDLGSIGLANINHFRCLYGWVSARTLPPASEGIEFLLHTAMLAYFTGIDTFISDVDAIAATTLSVPHMRLIGRSLFLIISLPLPQTLRALSVFLLKSHGSLIIFPKNGEVTAPPSPTEKDDHCLLTFEDGSTLECAIDVLKKHSGYFRDLAPTSGRKIEMKGVSLPEFQALYLMLQPQPPRFYFAGLKDLLRIHPLIQLLRVDSLRLEMENWLQILVKGERACELGTFAALNNMPSLLATALKEISGSGLSIEQDVKGRFIVKLESPRELSGAETQLLAALKTKISQLSVWATAWPWPINLAGHRLERLTISDSKLNAKSLDLLLNRNAPAQIHTLAIGDCQAVEDEGWRLLQKLSIKKLCIRGGLDDFGRLFKYVPSIEKIELILESEHLHSPSLKRLKDQLASLPKDQPLCVRLMTYDDDKLFALLSTLPSHAQVKTASGEKLPHIWHFANTIHDLKRAPHLNHLTLSEPVYDDQINEALTLCKDLTSLETQNNGLHPSTVNLLLAMPKLRRLFLPNLNKDLDQIERLCRFNPQLVIEPCHLSRSLLKLMIARRSPGEKFQERVHTMGQAAKAIIDELFRVFTIVENGKEKIRCDILLEIATFKFIETSNRNDYWYALIQNACGIYTSKERFPMTSSAIDLGKIEVLLASFGKQWEAFNSELAKDSLLTPLIMLDIIPHLIEQIETRVIPSLEELCHKGGYLIPSSEDLKKAREFLLTIVNSQVDWHWLLNLKNFPMDFDSPFVSHAAKWEMLALDWKQLTAHLIPQERIALAACAAIYLLPTCLRHMHNAFSKDKEASNG